MRRLHVIFGKQHTTEDLVVNFAFFDLHLFFIWRETERQRDMRGLYSTLALIVTALIGLAASADWSLNDAKLTISSIDGSGGISER